MEMQIQFDEVQTAVEDHTSINWLINPVLSMDNKEDKLCLNTAALFL